MEHPITEMVTGIDLVEMMIRSASGEELKLKQDQLYPRGWAIESRIYAEDPQTFMPTGGLLTNYKERGSLDEGIRFDSGVEKGSDVSVFYDPLICKVSTHGDDRKEAIRKMKTALDNLVVEGN